MTEASHPAMTPSFPAGTRVTVLAGGTGGHIFPGLAVAEVLRRAGAKVSWLGTPHGLENRLVPPAGIELQRVAIRGLRGRGLRGWLSAPWRISTAIVQSWKILRSQRPRCVLSMGGYAAGPAGIAARLLRIDLVVHEQNAVAGWTNRLLAPLARRVCTGFPGVLAGARVTGNPVRPAISALPEPGSRFQHRTGPLRLLVIGGSQGAAVFNTVVPEALARLPAENRPETRHQAGAQVQSAIDNYKKAGVEAQVAEFVDDMAEAWAWADFAICRAGALTIAELAAAGVPAILVPLPAAVDDHQTANARFLEQAGGAWLMRQAGFGPAALAGRLADLTRTELVDMAVRARACARPDAAEQVAQACAEACR
ncbi:MAG: undecaprenyldiphospho-muramoylpentapeptide beta-N-acetylglucosaminyltransferase [Wenzhouxiangellaceae bacterium]|nr:undecaprenyldiphospho-muramoylpentapeptide beta-N-acetylglucosaminyltransferase [Wenzhouxiangellaceae bacterium]